MSWAIVASVGVSLVGSAMSNNSAKKATNAASSASQAELDFAKEQYADWVGAFGNIQANLSEYYENLTPAFVETQMLQEFEQEKTKAMLELDEDLAQRGIQSSGLAASIARDEKLYSATERARIRAEAPIKVAGMQQEFLQIGLGQNPASSVSDALASKTNNLQQTANIATRASGEATGAAVDTTFNALSKLLSKNNTPPPRPDVVGVPMGSPNSLNGSTA